MKPIQKLFALLLVFAFSISLMESPAVQAAEQLYNKASSTVEALEETSKADTDDPNFWQEFHEEYADDAEYLQWYEFYQRQGSTAALQVQAAENANPYTGAVYDHGVKKDLAISYGIDVSYFQGTIDWEAVKADGISFAILRCGRTGYSKSNFSMAEDKKFREYIAGASQAGLAIGVYYFSQAQTEAEAKQEAEFTVSILKDYQDLITLPVFLDVEQGTNYRINEVTKAQGVKNAKKFFSILEKAGYQVGLYGNGYDLTTICDYTQFTDYPLWYARYNTTPGFSGEYEYWQYSGSDQSKYPGSVHGIQGYVDCNFRYLAVNSVEPPANTLTGTTAPVPADPEPAPAKPAKVTGLKKTASTTTSITLEWEPVEGATKYRVYSSALKNGEYTAVATITDTSLTVSDLNPNYGYYFKVRGYNKAGWGTHSDVMGALTDKGQQRSFYTTAAVHLRSYVGTEYSILTTIPKNTVLNISSEQLGTNGGSWYKVTYTDADGESYTGYLTAEYAKVGPRARTTEKVTLRSSASDTAAAKVAIKAGKKLILLSTKKDANGKKWYKVYYKTGTTSYTGYLPVATAEKY